MKTQLVESHRERVRRIESRRAQGRRPELYTEHEPSPLQEGEDGGILHRRPAGRAGPDRRARRVARRARRRRRRRRARRAAGRCRGPVGRTSCPHARGGQGGRHHRRVGGARCARCFGEYRAPTGVAGPRPRCPTTPSSAELREQRRARVRGARPADQDPRRQAGPRRPLQRRRADRRARSRRRHGRGLRGHPADARRGSPRTAVAGGRARGRAVDPLRLAPRADPGRAGRAAAPRAPTCPSWSAGSSRRPTRRADRGAAWRGCTRPRTSRSRGSWATSSSWWPSATASRRPLERRRARPPPARGRPVRRAGRAQPDRGPLGARTAPAALLAEVSPAALGGEAPAHLVGVTGPPGAGKSSLLSALVARLAGARADGRRARGGPVVQALRRLAAGRPRADRPRPAATTAS